MKINWKPGFIKTIEVTDLETINGRNVWLVVERHKVGMMDGRRVNAKLVCDGNVLGVAWERSTPAAKKAAEQMLAGFKAASAPSAPTGNLTTALYHAITKK